MELVGILKAKGDEKQVSDKFRKRDGVITIDHNGQYPQHIPFQVTQDRCSLLDNHKVGDEIRLHFNFRGREWTDPKDGQVKYFMNLEGWKIENIRTGASSQASATAVSTGAPAPADDLPF